MTLRKFITPLLLVATAGLTTGCELVAAVDRDLIDDSPGERGVLGGYQGGTVFGWATGATDAPAAVRVVIDGEEFPVQADQPRPDVASKLDARGNPLDADGLAGFKVENLGVLAPGTEIRAFIIGSELELTNSPFIVGDPVGAGSGGGMMGSGGAGGTGGGS